MSASFAVMRSLANCSLALENSIDERVATATIIAPRISAQLETQNQKSAAGEAMENISSLTVLGLVGDAPCIAKPVRFAGWR
jgi:hypothetical protein